MANLTYRASSPAAPASTTTKTTGLTNADVDGNFKSLDDAKYEKSGGTISGNLTVTGSSSLNSLSVTNTITGSISGNAATVTTNANLTGDVTSVGNATAYTTVGTAKGGTNITSYAAGDVLYASAANTLSKLAKGSDGQVLKLSGGFPAWGTDNDTTYNIGDGALTVASTAAATNVAITLALSGAYSANTATARSLDFKVGPALTNLATLMTTSTAGFIRRSGQDSYSVDTSTYSLSSHGHYIGTTAVQASSADQSLGGILSVTGGTASNFTLKTADVASAATGILYIKSGDVTAGNASSGAVGINSGSGFGTQAAGSVSIYSGNGGLTSATGGSVSIQGGGSRAATSTGGSVTIWGGSALSTATTAATGGSVFIFGGRTYNASGTKAGGNVYIDGGIDASTGSQYATTAGTVNIGNNASGYGGAGTSAVNIGSTSATTTIAGIIKLPTVGASGFVKLGTGGQLSADTTAYLSGVVAIANGGTNITTYAAGEILYASAANVLSKLAKGSDGQVLKLASGLPAWGTDNDNDTTYTAITATEITTGTATDLRTITGAGAKLIADRNAADTAPSAHGTAAIGTSLKYARQDHVHASDNTDTNTITTIKGGTGTAVSGAVEFAAGTNVSITQAGQVVTINSSYTDTNTTYSASTGLTLTGTAFSANYGTTSTTACAGNDSRLSNAREASGGTATNANNVYVTQTDNTTNYDYSLLLTAGAAQNISLRADITGGPTYNPLRNALCLDGFASHVWAYPALQLGRDWSIAQDAYGYSFAAGCKATSASAWTGTGNFSKAMRFTLDANYGTFYWYVKPTDTANTTTAITFRTAMSLDIDGNLNTFGTVSGSNLSGTNTGDQTLPTTLPASDVYAWAKASTKPSYAFNEISSGAISATTGTFSGALKAASMSIESTTSEVNLYLKYPGETRTSYFYKNATTILGYFQSTAIVGYAAFTIDYDYNFTATGNVTAYSDARIKTNITKIDNALDKVEQLNGYTFDRTDIKGPRQTGVIAQEVLKVLPEAVIGSEDTTYAVAYGNMMGLMIEAIKELNAKVADLQNQLANK